MTDQVYFLSAAGKIKIGYTASLHARLSSITASIGERVTLLGAIDGGVPLERALQWQLRDFRLHGEWFQDCEDVREWIAGVLADGPQAMGVYVRERPKAERPPLVDKNGKKLGHPMPRVALVLWPLDAIDQLHALTGYPKETVKAWLTYREPIPRLVRFAFAGVVARFCEDESVDFVNEPDSVEQPLLTEQA